MHNFSKSLALYRKQKTHFISYQINPLFKLDTRHFWIPNNSCVNSNFYDINAVLFSFDLLLMFKKLKNDLID